MFRFVSVAPWSVLFLWLYALSSKNINKSICLSAQMKHPGKFRIQKVLLAKMYLRYQKHRLSNGPIYYLIHITVTLSCKWLFTVVMELHVLCLSWNEVFVCKIRRFKMKLYWSLRLNSHVTAAQRQKEKKELHEWHELKTHLISFEKTKNGNIMKTPWTMQVNCENIFAKDIKSY